MDLVLPRGAPEHLVDLWYDLRKELVDEERPNLGKLIHQSQLGTTMDV